MDFLAWLGSSEKEIVAERDAQLTYARNFALVTVFAQTTALFFSAGYYSASAFLAIWAFFLLLCLGLPPAPRFLPKARSPFGHQLTGALVTLFGIAFQWILFMVVYANLTRNH